MAEQLVDVPTDVVLIEQIVSIPVPVARSVPGYGFSQGFLQDRVRRLLRSRSFTLQLVVEFLEVFKVFSQDMVR